MLRSRIPQITVQMEILVDEAIEEGAEEVAQAARNRLQPHHVTGRLEESVHLDEQRDGVYVVAGGGRDATIPYRARDVFWGHFLEFGTSRSAPYPFLVPSLEERRTGIVQRVHGALKSL